MGLSTALPLMAKMTGGLIDVACNICWDAYLNEPIWNRPSQGCGICLYLSYAFNMFSLLLQKHYLVLQSESFRLQFRNLQLSFLSPLKKKVRQRGCQKVNMHQHVVHNVWFSVSQGWRKYGSSLHEQPILFIVFWYVRLSWDNLYGFRCLKSILFVRLFFTYSGIKA